MRTCKCGELVEDHIRFHYAKPYDQPTGGHYVEDEVPSPVINGDGQIELEEIAEDLPVNMQRAWQFFGHPPFRAPPPTLPIPAKELWSKEHDLRFGALQMMRTFGYAIYDMEQGYRDDQSTRVGEGIGDAYFQGHGLRGWIEFKRWDNEPRDTQRAFGLEELAHGGIYLLVYEGTQLLRWHQAITTSRSTNDSP